MPDAIFDLIIVAGFALGAILAALAHIARDYDDPDPPPLPAEEAPDHWVH